MPGILELIDTRSVNYENLKEGILRLVCKHGSDAENADDFPLADLEMAISNEARDSETDSDAPSLIGIEEVAYIAGRHKSLASGELQQGNIDPFVRI